MLTYQLEKKGKSSLYESLYEAIREDILTGKLVEGTKLPSKRAFAEHLQVSVTTVENAYSHLLEEGYIFSRVGSGFFVNSIGKTVTDFNQKKHKQSDFSVVIEEPEQEEPEYAVDFKANRTSLSLFPYATWSKLLRNILGEQNIDMLKTVPYNGIYTLRKAIAEYLYTSRNMVVSPSQIVVGAGTEYLYTKILQLLGPDNIFAIEDPGYKKFAQISSSQHTLWDYIPIDEEGIRIDYLRTRKANIVHVSPANHFPTGIVIPMERRIELLEWAYEANDRFIIEDDYDSELRYTGKNIPTLFAMDQQDKVIYMNTFSKSMVPSIRISYMVLPKILMTRYTNNLSFYSCTVSSFEQLALARFISEGYFERHINRLKQHYKEKRDTLIDALTYSPLSKISQILESDAGTHFLLRVRTDVNDDTIRQRASDHNLRIAMLSDYETYPTLKNSRTIVVNYAGLDSEKIYQATHILEMMFAEEISAQTGHSK